MADKRNTVEYVKNYIEKNIGYLLLSNEYKNNKTPLLVKCDKGHEYTTTWNRISSKGARCPECDKIKRIEKQTFSYDFVKNIIEKEDYKLLSNNYVKSIMPLKIKCDKGHIYKTSLKRYINNHRCPLCFKNGQVSKSEKRVLKIVKNIYNGIVFENCKNVIKNPKTNRYLELDIWMPELNKAIEYNGYYYHSSPEVIERDKIKMNQCNNLQINLLVIKDVNWKTENEKINSLVKDFIQR